jgi:solute carrier family 25 uncoupling protein 8/9
MEKKKYSPNNLPLHTMMLSGGISGGVAEIAPIPLDTAKVRLQVQSNTGKYRGMFHCVRTMASEEGVLSLYKGLSAGLQRQVVFASLRIGLYEPVKQFYVGKDHTGPISVFTRILAALTTGAIGITVANPTDVVKIRFQGEGKKPESERRYKTVRDAYRKIIRDAGYF